MSNTNKIVAEGRMISELPRILDFTQGAVVIVVDAGKTAQMSLSHLVNVIVSKAGENDTAIAGRITNLQNNMTAIEKNIKNIQDIQSSFQQSVTRRFDASDLLCTEAVKTAADANLKADSIAYIEESFDLSKMQMPWYTYTTHHAVAGEVFEPVLNPAADADYYACCQPVKKGCVFTLAGCQDIVPILDAKYFVVVDESGIALDVVPIHDLLEEGYSYEFKEDGSFYLSSKSQSDEPLFKLKYPAAGVPAVTAADNGKILQVVDGKWTLADAAAYASGNEVEY